MDVVALRRHGVCPGQFALVMPIALNEALRGARRSPFRPRGRQARPTVSLAKGDENAFADRLISHMKLDGSTASLVHELFGTTSNNLLAASVTIVIGLLIWGLSIGQQCQDLYARAWRIHVGTAADQVRFTIWYFVFAGVLALMTVAALGAPGERVACAAPGLDRRLDGFLALDPALPAPSRGLTSFTPTRGAPRDVRGRRDDRYVAALDRPDAEPERKGVLRFRRRYRPPGLHPHRRHHLDGPCRLRPGLGRMAPGRDRAEGIPCRK